MRQKLRVYFLLLLTLVSYNAIGADDKTLPQDQAVPFTLADRDRITRMEVKIDEMDKRLDQTREDLSKRFEEVLALFTAITIAIFGFAIWDRRTMVRPFETKVKEVETNIELKGIRVEKILISLRELAKTDSKLAEILRNNQLL